MSEIERGVEIPDEVERDLPKPPFPAWAIRALDAACLWEPEAMLKLADRMEAAPYYAICEAQYLRGIARRISTSTR